jgi:sterol desaturase/sphingolipid hydroxylase (fatty acid hydroxylase superfamily)
VIYFLLGFILWTLVEYVVHRWVLHNWMHLADHNVHHGDPGVETGVPFRYSFGIFAVLLLVGFYFGLSSGLFVTGLLVGYVVYLTMHEAYHRNVIGAKYHGYHHKLHNVNYGISSPIWDFVFRTYK